MELIHNGIIVNEGTAQRGFIVINGGYIARVGTGDASQELIDVCDTVTDARGAYVMPGVIDDHVHMREPGLTHKATMASESRAAVAGGPDPRAGEPAALGAARSKAPRGAWEPRPPGAARP